MVKIGYSTYGIYSYKKSTHYPKNKLQEKQRGV